MTNGELNLLWSSILIEELSRLPISLIALAPGSRSSALAVAVAQNQKVKTFIHFDERALGFYALGAAKACGKPAVIITTSGTAVANLLPAVIEASNDNIPLIIISADRPAELYEAGTNQTIDQVKIFGSYVRWFFDLPCPSATINLALVCTTIDQSLAMAIQSGNCGPVHLNCRFTEPLLPDPNYIFKKHIPKHLIDWNKHNLPLTQIITHTIIHRQKDYKSCVKLFSKAKSGLVIIGKIDKLTDKAQIITLINKLNWPVFPDITSQLKIDNLSDLLITDFDARIADDPTLGGFQPDCILHIGGRLTSKRLAEYLNSLAILKPNNTKTTRQIIKIQNNIQREDEFNQITIRLIGIENTCKKLATYLNTPSPIRHPDFGATSPLSANSFTEQNICLNLSKLIPADNILFIGNSLPIRHLQRASNFSKESPFVLTNRGASGIDGLIATAAGCANGLETPTTILLGDLSALHDLNSLLITAKSKVPIIIVILNNDGGAIFSTLAVSKWKEACIPFFVTPHGQTFQGVSEGFGLSYKAIRSISDLKQEYQKALIAKTSTVLECLTK